MIDQTPLVSVVLPTYNRAESVIGAIHSILEQTYRNLELIVVDDDSSDDTVELIEEISDSRVRLMRHETNRGATAARNSGIEAAQGRFIAFQDSDDEWLPEKLAKQMHIFAQAPRHVGAVYCGFLRIGEGAPTYIPGPQVRTRCGDISRELLHGNFVSTQTLVVRRECFEAGIMFWNELPRFQDWELALSLASKWKFKLVDEPLVNVYMTDNSISSDEAAGVEALEMILDRHRAKFQAAPSHYADYNMFIARHHLNGSDSAEARKYIFRALEATPMKFRLWAYLGTSYFGRSIFGKFCAIKNYIQGLF